MELLISLFHNMAAFSGWAPGIDTNCTLDDLRAAGLSTQKQVEGILSHSVLETVIDSGDEALLTPLRTAVANRTLANNAVFNAHQKRVAGTDVYKYEVEQMRRSYIENYYNAMDSLLTVLTHLGDDNPIGTVWRQTRYYALISSCRLQTPDDFDSVYNIDGSCLFFFRTLPIQREVLAASLGVYYDKADGNERATAMLDLCLAKRVVATAVRRFDILECPATVRNLFDDSKVSGQRKDERQQADALADRLDSEAAGMLDLVDTLLAADTNADVSSYSAFNREEDNIIMMP